MKKHLILFALVLVPTLGLLGQKQLIELTFTAVDNVTHIQLDSVKVINRSQGTNTTLYWPDTSLILEMTPGDKLLNIGYTTGYPVGTKDEPFFQKTFQFIQAYPNPFSDQNFFILSIPEKGVLNFSVIEITGKEIHHSSFMIRKGNHLFRFTPGDGILFIITASWNGFENSIKVLSTGSKLKTKCDIEYMDCVSGEPEMKETRVKSSLIMHESGILDEPGEDKIYSFQFAENIPCLGTPTVTYEGQVYNTIQIFSQCWLKENLNVGTMIPGMQPMMNNSIIEKYCYNDNVDSCTKYGGLYQWWEMMQYDIHGVKQGICPPGWHVPTDDDWNVLEGAVDSQVSIGDQSWENSGERGYDAGFNLKSTTGWYEAGNGNDLFQFSCLAGGSRGTDGGFYGGLNYGVFWSSSESDFYAAWRH